MPTYTLIAKVDQVVTKEVKMIVEAGSEEEAEAKGREALATYPEATGVEGIQRLLTVSSHYWIPKSVEFSKVKRNKDG